MKIDIPAIRHHQDVSRSPAAVPAATSSTISSRSAVG